MKKNILIMAIIIIGIIGCCNTVNAIEDLGTVDYKDYAQKDIISTGEVNLTFIFSTLDESALTIDKILYIPSTNKTKYVFTSNVIEPEWWMNFSDISFFYQNENTLEIYEIKIDYNDIEIPENPWEIELDILLNVSADLNNLTTTYNALKTDYNTTVHSLMMNRSKLNTTTQEYNNLSIEITNLTKQFINKSTDYNTTMQDLIFKRSELNTTIMRMSANITSYQNFYEDMNSNMGLFSFKDPDTGVKRYYMPKMTADSKIENMQSQLDINWLWIVLTILFTAVIVVLLVKLTSSKQGSTSAEKIVSGYTEDMKNIDRIGLKDKIKTIIKPKKQQTSANPNNVEEMIEKVAEKTAEKTRLSLSEEISKQIDMALKTNGKKVKA